MLNVIKASILFFIIIFTSCSSKKKIEEKIEKNTYEVLSTILDEYAKPRLIIPPPMLEGVPDTIKRVRDSIMNLPNVSEWLNQEHLVAIRPELFELNKKKYYISPIKEKEYQRQVENLFSKDEVSKSNNLIQIDSLTSTRGNIFIEAPTDNDLRANKKLWDNFDLFFTSSEIKFNNQFDKALLVIGISRASLDGFSRLLLLEKKEGKWKIIYYRTLMIS